jgi:hypothetical protein
MAKRLKAGKARRATVGERSHHFEGVVDDPPLAAGVAAEESAGYGSVTSMVEAAEAAVVPEHELGHEPRDQEKQKKEDTEVDDA